MKRRDFLKRSLLASAALGMGPGFMFSKALAASGAIPRSVVNTIFQGGADLRHLFVPPPDATIGSYGEVFWKARELLYNVNSDPTWSAQNEWNNSYFHVTHKGKSFGIHKSAAWLKDQFVLGNVAIMCNVLQATNQRHDHATLILNSGDRLAENFNLGVSGWGGRLAYAIGSANVLSYTKAVSLFCQGTNSTNLNEKVISAPDMRNVALSGLTTGTSNEAILNRSLMAYYARRGVSLEGTPYARIVQHNSSLRALGGVITSALIGTTRPDSIVNLYQAVATVPPKLFNTYLGRQVASLYDASLVSTANRNAINMRIASLEVSGWDTHKYQNDNLSKIFSDVFGTDKAFDTLSRNLNVNDNDNIIYTFTSEFGRQLGANGTWGTDHGVGTYMIILGNSVRGDVYGEMFPVSEIPKFTDHHNYITGLTAFERILGEVCNWVEPGTADLVFPLRNTYEIETGVNLSALFSNVYKISGVIRDGAGLPISSVAITITDGTGISWNTTSDANGQYSLAELLPGAYNMVFSRKLYDIPQAGFSIVNSDVTKNIVGNLYPGTVRGRVTTPVGVPVVGQEIWDMMNYPESITRTDANGNYKLVGIRPGATVWINASSIKYTLSPTTLTLVHPGGDVTGKNFSAMPNFADADMDTVPDEIDNCINVVNPDQRDTNHDGFGNACDADLNNDGVVNFADLAEMKSRFYTSNPDADLNGDGVVNFEDLAVLKKYMFKMPGPSGLVK